MCLFFWVWLNVRKEIQDVWREGDKGVWEALQVKASFIVSPGKGVTITTGMRGKKTPTQRLLLCCSCVSYVTKHQPGHTTSRHPSRRFQSLHTRSCASVQIDFLKARQRNIFSSLGKTDVSWFFHTQIIWWGGLFKKGELYFKHTQTHREKPVAAWELVSVTMEKELSLARLSGSWQRFVHRVCQR